MTRLAQQAATEIFFTDPLGEVPEINKSTEIIDRHIATLVEALQQIREHCEDVSAGKYALDIGVIESYANDALRKVGL